MYRVLWGLAKTAQQQAAAGHAPIGPVGIMLRPPAHITWHGLPLPPCRFVFEGKPPERKREELAKRAGRREGATAELEAAKEVRQLKQASLLAFCCPCFCRPGLPLGMREAAWAVSSCASETVKISLCSHLSPPFFPQTCSAKDTETCRK